ncbi:MAG: hypothetical protein H0W42_11605 [Gemmatimonadaceae bacterium]|nr:hypothetical protein [Gemmatimonadaceae bacterium]
MSLKSEVRANLAANTAIPIDDDQLDEFMRCGQIAGVVLVVAAWFTGVAIVWMWRR